jgi:hypothetical protein
VWTTVGASGGQVAYHIGDREKASLKSIDIRIRNPMNSKIPIEVTGEEKLTRACALEFITSDFGES